ncbi:MAG: 23S rRNA methyltransferase [Coriobacteriia bacterium]|nr:23S rRNA methyltransferase [Coriobacteriia bacterium]
MLSPDGLLICPVCRAPLSTVDRTMRCAAGHAFDIARQGYVNLLPGAAHATTGDTREMIDARAAFLAAGHFAPLTSAIAGAVAEAAAGVDGVIIDVGAGIGHYLEVVLGVLSGRIGVALDLSKHAARAAARVHPAVVSVVCDAWTGLPVADGAAAVVMNVFAPRNPTEFARVLGPRGALVTATPRPGHLRELVGPLGLVTIEQGKEERLGEALGDLFQRSSTRAVSAELALSRADVSALVMMGPSAHHIDPETLADALGRLPGAVSATLSVSVTTWLAENT